MYSEHALTCILSQCAPGRTASMRPAASRQRNLGAICEADHHRHRRVVWLDNFKLWKKGGYAGSYGSGVGPGGGSLLFTDFLQSSRKDTPIRKSARHDDIIRLFPMTLVSHPFCLV